MDIEKIAGFLQLTLKAILRNSKDLIFIKDTDLKYIGVSLAFARMAGFESSEDLLGKSDYEIFDRELARKYTEDDRLVLKSGEPIVNLI